MKEYIHRLTGETLTASRLDFRACPVTPGEILSGVIFKGPSGSDVFLTNHQIEKLLIPSR